MEKLKAHIKDITNISDEDFEHIKTFFTLKKVKKHQHLIQEDEQVKFEFLILSGVFRAFYLDASGKEHIIQFATENWWLSDYVAYFKQLPASTNVICMEAGEVLCLTLEGREKLSENLHSMEHFFRVKLTNAYVAQQKRIVALLSSNPQKRFEEFAKLYPDLMQRIPKKYIAEYLGVSRETLSRLYSANK